jgi:hypothetical protein
MPARSKLSPEISPEFFSEDFAVITEEAMNESRNGWSSLRLVCRRSIERDRAYRDARRHRSSRGDR